VQTGSKRCCKQSCDPCPLVSDTARRILSYQQHLLSTMSAFMDKAQQKVKKKVDRAMDRFRPSPRESRAASPSQQTEHSGTSAPAAGSQSSIHMAFSDITQPLIVPTSVATPSSQLPSPAAANASSSSLQSDYTATPAYSRPTSPTKILTITGSAVKVLLAAARDGSDLFLPLKAALVSVLAIWDIVDVCYSTLFI